jgi:hypothetical protein
MEIKGFSANICRSKSELENIIVSMQWKELQVAFLQEVGVNGELPFEVKELAKMYGFRILVNANKENSTCSVAIICRFGSLIH